MRRHFLTIVGQMVYALWAGLTIWKCDACGKTRRRLPPNVKRWEKYLPVAAKGWCGEYLRDPKATYRGVANSAGPLKSLPFLYEAADEAAADGRSLSHVTIWRRMGVFAEMLPQVCQRLERQQNAADVFDLSAWKISPHKYCTTDRMDLLIACAQVLAAWVDSAVSTPAASVLARPFRTLAGFSIVGGTRYSGP